MDRKLAHLETIREVIPHNNADSLEIVKILGWTLCVLKGQFQKDQQVVFIEPDAILPEGRPEWEFMRDRHFRVKTIRLRGVISQGLVFPKTILPMPAILEVELGQDVTELLGITKYEPYIPAQLAGKIKGNFPGFLHKTDEQRIQGVPEVLERWKGFAFLMTEKIDGTSFTAYLKDGVFGVCSRNLELQEDDCNTVYWKIAKELDLKNKLEILGGNWAIQGELIGQGIQKNKYCLSNVQLKVFNIFNIDLGKYLDQDDLANKIVLLGLDPVPLLNQIVLNHTVDQLVELSKGSSKLNSKIPREGIVFRPEHEMYDEDLGRLSFKQINPEFLLKYDE